MKFASLFSGIGGFDLALENAGIRACFQCEQDDNARAVLENHWRHIQGTTDVTDAFTTESLCRIKPDGITAGWPCQGNSVAGRRAGMADERSGLWGEVVRILAAVRPRWFLGENVSGILSVNGGRDWLAVLRDLAELGYGAAYRVLDAQWFGVAQRRRRVFIVGCLGDWRRAAEVLFESESLPWDSAPSRETGTGVAALTANGVGTCGAGDNQGQGGHLIAANNFGVHDVARCLPTSNERIDGDTETFVTHTLTGEVFDASEDGTGRGTPVVPVGFSKASDPNNWLEDCMPPLTGRNGDCGNVSVFQTRIARNGRGQPEEVCPTLQGADAGETSDMRPVVFRPSHPLAAEMFGVRRLTPVECEKLQGFPVDWTRYREDGTELSDSARYRMLGNAVAVPVAEWIAKRIMEADDADDSD